MDLSPIWPIITALVGTGGAVTLGVQGFFKWKSGAAGREKAFNADMKTQRNEAIVDLEWERERYRVLGDKAAMWRRMAIEAGVSESQLGPWPSNPPAPRT